MINPGGDINIPVTVDESTEPWTLVVSNQTDVPESALPRNIFWNLQLPPGQDGAFNPPHPPGHENPGFEWTGGNKSVNSIFTKPTIQDTQIEIEDKNNGSQAKGTWDYKLCATIEGHSCETNPLSVGGEPGDPKIHNR